MGTSSASVRSSAGCRYSAVVSLYSAHVGRNHYCGTTLVENVRSVLRS